MPILGFNDMKQFVLPTGVDGGLLKQFELADGTNYEDLTNDLIAGLQIVGTNLLNSPTYSTLISETTEIAMEYRQGVGTYGMTPRTEYGKADVQRGSTIGHMLPINKLDRALGWTWDFLADCRRVQIDTDIQEVMYDVQDEWERRIFQRFFSTNENLLGTSGYDVPFVKGAGTVLFTPPPFNGQTFASTHNHFDRQAVGAQVAALKAGAKHLFEHGIQGPYLAIIPFVDTGTYTALTGWVKPARGLEYVRSDAAANFAVTSMDEAYIGAFESDHGIIYCWASPRLPTNYLGVYRSYGSNNPRNPLKVRYNAKRGVGPVLIKGEAMRQYPLENAMVIHDYGIGMGNRLNGYACYFNASGSYVNPTIT